MTQNAASAAQGCIFCAIAARQAETLKADSPERERSLLDSDARAIKEAIASTD